MKVGKGCMNELAPASAAQIAREFDIYSSWSEYLAAATAPESMGDGSFGSGRGFGSGVSVEHVYDKASLILAMRAALEKTDGKWITSEYASDRSYSTYGMVINKGSRTFDFIQAALDKNRSSLVPDSKYVDSVNADVKLCLERYPQLLGEKLEEVKTFAEADKARAIDIFLVKKAQDILKREAEREAQQEMSGHHFNDGEKVILEVKELKSFSFQGAFGTQFVVTYQTKCGKIVKYVGGSPQEFEGEEKHQLRIRHAELLKIERSNELSPEGEEFKAIEQELDQIEAKLKVTVKPEWFKIQGTVKHDNYKGPETKLLRIKEIFEKKTKAKKQKL